MSIVKSLAVGEGDMFYIRHGNDNFTVIDCCMSDDVITAIIREVKEESRDKGVVRFISTHPDDDHIRGLAALDDAISILNFYCVHNNATKTDNTADFQRYRELRESERKAFYLERGCSRRWMNTANEERGSAGINILWPVTDNDHFKVALRNAEAGESPNNISPIVKYGLDGGATVLWMGDLETDFMEQVKNSITMDAAEILFAPHHGRDSGKVPQQWLGQMNPRIVIIGEAPSGVLNYYAGYDTITQNSAGDITLECVAGRVHIYVSNNNYSVDFLQDEGMHDIYGRYIGSLLL